MADPPELGQPCLRLTTSQQINKLQIRFGLAQSTTKNMLSSSSSPSLSCPICSYQDSALHI